MPLPVTAEFNVFDWDGGVKISDPTQGLIASPETDLSHLSPIIEGYCDLYVSVGRIDGFIPGETVTSTAGWTAEVHSVNEDLGYVRVGQVVAGFPAAADDFTNGSVTRYIDKVDGVITFDAPGGMTVYSKVEETLPASSTLEFRIVLTSPPTSIGSGEHMFVGLYNPPTGSVGLKFAQDGIALVSDPKQPASALAGSSGLVGPFDMTYRLVMDSQNNLVHIYATQTSQVPIVGHILRYTSQIPPSEVQHTDQAIVSIGTLGSALGCDILSYRAAGAARIPNERPVAVTGDDQVYQLGGTARLDGRGSYDPEGQPLTYRWNVLRYPSGSPITLQDPAAAGYTLYWPLLAATATFTATQKGNVGNGIRVVTDPDAAFDMSYDSATRVATINYVAGVTTIADVVAAWSNPAYSEVTDVLDFDYTGSDLELLFFSSGLLSGGADGTGATNFFQPPAVGLYEIGLTVNDGEVDSIEVQQAVNIIEAQYALGYVPDGSIMWKALPDYWELIDGKGPYTTDFSALIQILTGLMQEAWQHDYAKSHATIPRYFQRRWMEYPPRLYEDASLICGESIFPVAAGYATVETVTDVDLTTRTIILETVDREGDFGTYAPGDSIILWPTWGSPQMLTVARMQTIKRTASGVVKVGRTRVLEDNETNFLALDVKIGDIVQIASGPLQGRHRILAVREKSLVLAGPPLSSNVSVTYTVGGILTIEEDDFAVREVLDSGEKNGFRGDAGLGWDDRLYLRGGGTFDSSIVAGDVLAVFSPKTGALLGTHTVHSVGSGGLYLRLTATLPPYHAVSWQVLRDHADEYVRVLGYHVFEVPTIDDMTKYLSPDDTVRCLVKLEGDDTQYDWMGHVIAVRGSRFACRPNVYVNDGLYEMWDPSLGLHPVPHGAPPKDALELEEFQVTEIWRLRRQIVDQSVRRIPRLQESAGDPSNPMLQTLDYLIEQEGDDRFITWYTVAEGFITNVDGAVLTIAGVDLIEAGVVAGATLVIPVTGSGILPEERWGAVRVLAVIDAETLVVDWPEADLEQIVALEHQSPWQSRSRSGPAVHVPFYILSYGAYNLPPPSLWAEVTYYDNSETIENNFGLAVGFPRDALGDNQLNLDYLSSTRAFWFAFWFGPTIANIRLGEQILFGLPFAEEAGTIVSIDDDYSGDKGRIIIETDTSPGRLLTYFYPLTAEIDTNPETGVPYVVGDRVSQFAPLCTGVEVHDYLTDQAEMDFLRGPNELKKYHTFKIKVSAQDVQSGYLSFERAIEFARTIKPVYTDVVLVVVFELSDTIEVSDHISFRGTLNLEDELYTTEDLGGGPDDYRWWLPWDVPTGKKLRSDFAHRLDYYDNEGNKPLRLWPTYAPKARYKLWIGVSEGDDDFEVDTLVYCVGPTYRYALRVIRSGPAYVICEYLPWTFDIKVAGTMSGVAGDLVWETSSTPPHWQGIVVDVAGNITTIALDNRKSVRTPSKGLPGSPVYPPQPPDQFTDGVYTETVESVSTHQFHPAAVGDVCTDNSGNSFTIREILDFPDYAQAFDRAAEVGPEVFTDLRACFWVGGDVAKDLDITETGGGPLQDNELIHHTPTIPPNWFAKVLRSAVAGPSLYKASVELVPIYEVVCSSLSGSVQVGDFIMGLVDGAIWGARVHMINGLTLYVERTTLLPPQPGESFTRDYTGTHGAISTVTPLTRTDPVPADTYVSSATGSVGNVTGVSPTTGRYPSVDLGLVADDTEAFSAPVDPTYSALVELTPPAGSAFDLNEEVYVTGHPEFRAWVRQKWDFALSLQGLGWTPVAGYEIVGLESGATATIVRTWGLDEYHVPSLGPGRYFWADTKFVDDFRLRVHIASGTPPVAGQFVQDNAYSPPRWAGEVMYVHPGGLYADIRPLKGYIRSQPVRGQSVEILPSPGPTFIVRTESWALQWVPALPVVDDQVLCRVKVGDATPFPKPPRKASQTAGDSAIVDVIGV